MKKTVLYLMNGFGVEQKDSYSVYNSNLMPNLDQYTKDYLFGSIETNAFDLGDAYRYFSTGSKYALTYPFIDQFSQNYDNNPNMKSLFERMPKETNIHLFVFIQNAKVFEQLKTFLEYVKSKCQNTIFLHIILDSKSSNDYKEFERMITKMNYDLKDYPIYTIIGKNLLKNKGKDYVAILNHGIGEKWREISKKFNSLQTSGIAPEDVEPFFVNDKFTLDEKDQIFFFNYQSADIMNFLQNLTRYNHINRFFSLFPLQGVEYPLFAYPTSQLSMARTLSNLKAKALIISSSQTITYINYYCNGLNNVISQSILFTKSDQGVLQNENLLKSLIEDPQFSLIIINDSIEECTTVDTLNAKLKQIDQSLKIVHDICHEKYTLVISSLYGINREFVKDNFTKVKINFSSKVPVIVKDEKYTKDKFYLDFGDIYSLANTVYKNIDLKHSGEVIIKQKNFLSKLVKK